jgi:hypothetical protein
MIIKVSISAAPLLSLPEPRLWSGQTPTARCGRFAQASNEFACMAHPGMCLDRRWQAWADARIKMTPPKVTALGIAYVLQGDGRQQHRPVATA